MFQIYISQVVFAQSAKYLIIISTQSQTTRTDVCESLTSTPTFYHPISLEDLSSFTVKACIATIDRKLTVIGSFKVDERQFREGSQKILQKNGEFYQTVEGKSVCVGRCKVTAQRKGNEIEVKNGMEQDDIYELKSEEQQEEDAKCQMRFIVHCGFDFYLNSGFQIQIKWGSQKKQTKIIKDRVYPVWNEMLDFTGSENKDIQVSVFDNKNNKLQWLKINPAKVRIMFPYHLKVLFREECVGTYPYFYLTFVREDVPKFSIIEKQIKLKIKYFGSSFTRKHQYLLIFPKQQQESTGRLPLFIELSMKNYIDFDQINKLVQGSQTYEWHHWNLFIPIDPTVSEQNVVLLKSMISRSLVCIFCNFQDAKNLFEKKLWNDVKIVDVKEMFENVLKKIYYHEEKVMIGKAVELSNLELVSMQDKNEAISEEEKWKILSQNFILRNQMIEKSLENTQNLKKIIKQKGQVLVDLKKTLSQVKKVNAIMVEKQRSAFVDVKKKKYQKVIPNFNKISTMEIIATLYEKQGELERRKKVNDEMRMRMDTLEYFSEDTEKLDNELVKNAKQLLEQQQKIKKMKKIKEALPKQVELIGRLQKIFEKRELDREINQLLKKQSQKLNKIRQVKRQNLENIYKVVKQHNVKPKTLPQQIKQAEQQLRRLNSTYAQLII